MTSTVRSTARRIPARVAEYPPGSTFGPRLLRDHEFVWVLRGSARWRVQEAGQTRELTLRPGTLALARAGTVDAYQWDAAKTSTHAYVHFDATGYDDPRPRDWPLVRPLDGRDPLAALCAYLVDLADVDVAGEVTTTRTEQTLALMLELFLAGPIQPAGADQLPPALRPAVEFVRETWQRDGMRLVALQEMAAASAVSVAYLSRAFKRQFGTGPAAALELVRLARAAITLERSNLTLAEVAQLVGYGDPFHFSKRFSGAYGMPPGRFRDDEEATDPMAPLVQAGLLELWHLLAR